MHNDSNGKDIICTFVYGLIMHLQLKLGKLSNWVGVENCNYGLFALTYLMAAR